MKAWTKWREQIAQLEGQELESFSLLLDFEQNKDLSPDFLAELSGREYVLFAKTLQKAERTSRNRK